MDEKKYFEMSAKRDRLMSGEQNITPATNGVELGVIVEDFVNGFNGDKEDEFLDYILTFAHRTLQQKYFGLVLKSIARFAEVEDRFTDPRNECSVRTARKIAELMKENGIPTRMPLI